jgi:hypothetical protein
MPVPNSYPIIAVSMATVMKLIAFNLIRTIGMLLIATRFVVYVYES